MLFPYYIVVLNYKFIAELLEVMLLWFLGGKPLEGKTLQTVFSEYNLNCEKSQHFLVK